MKAHNWQGNAERMPFGDTLAAMAIRKAWTYGPEKVTLKWRDPDRKTLLALDLTFYGPTKATGRIECVEVALRSVADEDIPVRSRERDVIKGVGTAAPILADYFRSNIQLSTKIGVEKAKLLHETRRSIAAEVSSASRSWTDGVIVPISPKSVALVRESARAVEAMLNAAKRGGRPRALLTDALLTKVAEVYRDGYPNPAQAVAKHFVRAQSTTDKWIHAAREAGKLPKTRRGVIKA
jgi:hypothetical protein